MEVKKAPQADLEKRRGLFLQIGFVLVLASVLLAFEWSTGDANDREGIEVMGGEIDDDIIPITWPTEVKPPPPPPAKIIDIIEIVENDAIIEDELFIDPTDSDEDDIIVFDIPIVEETFEDSVFIHVEEMPSFPGGTSALMSFIGNEIKYPLSAIESNIQGRVFVQFVVSKTGSVTNVMLLRGVHTSLNNEAIRVVSAMPKWNPGRQSGRAVQVSYTVPINFSLR